MIPRMNTSCAGETVRDALRHLRYHLRDYTTFFPDTSTCSAVDDGTVTIHGVNVAVNTTNMTVLRPPCANMTDACNFLLNEHNATPGVTYLVISADNSKVQMRLRSPREDRAIARAVRQYMRDHATPA